MKLTLNQKFEYTLFGVLNLFFATPMLILATIHLFTRLFFLPDTSNEFAFLDTFVGVYIVFLFCKLLFVSVFYLYSEDMRSLFKKFFPTGRILSFAIGFDFVVYVLQALFVSTFADKSFAYMSDILYVVMLGGVTSSYLVWAILRATYFFAVNKLKKSRN